MLAKPDVFDAREKRIMFKKAKNEIADAPTYSQLRFWAMRGVKVRGRKERVKLPFARLPNGLATTRAAYEWFIRTINGCDHW
jgi:hypothetical protein